MTGTTVIIFCTGVITFEAVYISFVLFIEAHLFPAYTVRLSIISQYSTERVEAEVVISM